MKQSALLRIFVAVCMTFAVGGLLAPSASAGNSGGKGGSGGHHGGRSCLDYIPSDLALSSASAAPGQSVTLSGIGAVGDTVTVRISRFGGFPVVLGTAVVGADGRFSFPFVVPADYPVGTYTVSVSSPKCGVSSISLVVKHSRGSCSDRKTITEERGATVSWALLGDFDESKQVSVALVPRNGGAPVNVFSGPYPSSGSVLITVPASLADGSYRIEETGFGADGRQRSARCGRLIVKGGSTGTTTTTTTTTTTVPGPTTTVPGPTTTVPGPTTTVPGPTTTVPGPTTTVPGPTTTVPGPTTTVPSGVCTTQVKVQFEEIKLVNWSASDEALGYVDTVYTANVAVALAAGTWNINDVISTDGYVNRSQRSQLSEIWDIEFLSASGAVLATSAQTGDVPDGEYQQWVGNLGEVVLPAGVVAVRAHHLPNAVPEPSPTPNSVIPVSFTACLKTAGNTVVTSTTAAGATSTSTAVVKTAAVTGVQTVDNSGVRTIDESAVLSASASRNIAQVGSSVPASASVRGATTSAAGGGTASALAVTGSTIRPLIIVAVLLVALGGLFAMTSRRRRN